MNCNLKASGTVVRQLPLDVQRLLIEDVRGVLKQSPLVRPRTPGGHPMRVKVSAAGTLGWVGDGAYRYDRLDSSGNEWPPMPPAWKEIADEVAGQHHWDSAIINWYDEDASLGWHQDKSEADTSLPIVTISLGDAASWAIRKGELGKPSRVQIDSGAITLLAGETRNLYHSVERVIAAPLLSPLSKRGRISITIRVAG